MKNRLFDKRQSVIAASTIVLAIVASTAHSTLRAEYPGAPSPAGLRLLPENPRYFEYKGLPLALFGHQADRSPLPSANAATLEAVRSAS